MSTLSNGENQNGKEPIRKTRRTSRSGKRNKHKDDAARNGIQPDANLVAGGSKDTNQSHSFDNKNGSEKPAENSGKGAAGKKFKTSPTKDFHKKRGKKHRSYNPNSPHEKAGENIKGSVANKVQQSKSNSYPNEKHTDQNANEKNDKGISRWFGRRNGKNKRRGSLYAALDLGTNNCRLLVAAPQEVGNFKVVDGFSRIVRLGEGLDDTGALSDAAMDRAIGALKECAIKLKKHKIKRQRLIATEACRQASNGEAFIARVRKEAGLDLEIVDRQSEAYLAAEGCGSLIDKKCDAAVLFDIGGGSSEVILVRGKGQGKHHGKRWISDRITGWTSLPMGVVTLAERFGGEEVTPQLFEKMVEEVLIEIEKFEGRDALAKAFREGRVHLLGTSGTVTTIAGIHLKLPRYDRNKVDGIWLQDKDMDKVIEDLLEMSYEQRAQNPCIGSERADLVLAGCAILNAIRQAWPTPYLRVADRGLREGILAQMVNQDGAWIKRRRFKPNSRRKPFQKHRKVQENSS